MNVRQAKATARAWVEANAPAWPGLRAAHLVGGITSLPDEAPFPATKDVDLHLIVDEASATLEADGPGPNLLEVTYGGLAIEAGVKSETDYASAEVVLANPEIAYHLIVDSVLFDPTGWLRSLQEPVRRNYRRRRWVQARLAYERQGFAGALDLLRSVSATWGASGEVNILGYTTTFLAASLAVARVCPPRLGVHVLIHLRQHLAAQGRLDVHEEVLSLLGVRDVSPQRVEEWLHHGAEAFDLALKLRHRPHPFLPGEHKLHSHLRPYVVDANRDMIAQGYHREVLPWIAALALATTDLILFAGPQDVRPRFAAQRAELLRELGFDSEAARTTKREQLPRIGERVFALAEEIVSVNPDIVA
jgi:hypothetical protein